MATVRNISTGARGAYLKGQLVMAEPGEIIEADDFVKEWFGPAADQADDDDGLPSLSGKNKAELLEIAAAEEVANEDGATNAEIVAAIEAKRADANP